MLTHFQSILGGGSGGGDGGRFLEGRENDQNLDLLGQKKVIKMSRRSFSADSSDSVSRKKKHFFYETHKNVSSY